VVDSATAEALQRTNQYDKRYAVRAMTPRPVRGMGLVRPYALVAADA
jgi:hypothetical protein